MASYTVLDHWTALRRSRSVRVIFAGFVISNAAIAFFRGNSVNWHDFKKWFSLDQFLWTLATTLAALLLAVFYETRNIVRQKVQEQTAKTREVKADLKNALENLNGCPRLILGHDPKTLCGFFVVTTVADARMVQLEPIDSPHYRLTADLIPYIASGVPQVPLELHVELISPKPGMIESADRQDAWKAFADDGWSGRNPYDTPDEFVDGTRNTNLLIALRFSYGDFCGKIRYTSSAVVAWEPLLGSIVDIRPGLITKELI